MSIALRGAGGAPGIALGPAALHLPAQPELAHTDADPQLALARFAAAQLAAVQTLNALAERLRAAGRAAEAGIFEAQALLAEDPFVSQNVERRVREGGEPLLAALAATIGQMRGALNSLDDPYLRERADDMDAIGSAILAELRDQPSRLQELPAGAIVVAADLTPAEAAELHDRAVAGLAMAYGGPTGHTAILARALGIPAVIGLGSTLLDIKEDTELIIDGAASLLIAAPTLDQREGYLRRKHEQDIAAQSHLASAATPGRLADGHAIAVWANIGHPDEAHLALQSGAEGIGLFRSEFLFLGRDTAPDEEEQYQAYRRTLEIMAGSTVTIRTLDIGGDKRLPYLDMPHEDNPFLGWRALRLCMRHPTLFTTQLRAVLRAAAHGDLRIMVPMVATLDDLRWGRAQLRAAAASLAAEGVEHRADLPFGVMIETPAAAITADLLAPEVDFFSIGSNDLTQYTMAIDRGQAELAARYPHDAPAVLRLIAQAAAAAQSAGIPVGICGELAGVPELASILAGLGVGELSMAAASIPLVKAELRKVTQAQARAQAQAALAGERGVKDEQ